MGPGDLERRLDSTGAFRALLKCPSCHSDDVLIAEPSLVACSRCRTAFSVHHDIIDFVAGRKNTALDVAAYDRQKDVSATRSTALFRHLQNVLGSVIIGGGEAIMEIGAGTGLLTLGMLESSEFGSAVITDISKEMLRVCQTRVQQCIGDDRFSRVLFATYSGEEDIFATGAFDLCIANSVVHHILDYYEFFANVRKALKPTGRAIFVEPGAPFHNALTLALNDTLIPMIADGVGPIDANIGMLARWTAEVRSGIICPDAPDKMKREDKHVFWRDELQSAARAAGFADLSILPWDFDPLGTQVLKNYLRGLGVSKEFAGSFIHRFARISEYHFRDLAGQDKSSMYAIDLIAAKHVQI